MLLCPERGLGYMTDGKSAQKVELEDQYYHVRYEDPDAFDTVRTPDWAANAASSVSEGAEVRMGKRESSDDWLIESVLIPEDSAEDEEEARDKAQQIVEKIE